MTADSPTTLQTLQVVTNLIQVVGVISLVTLAVKFTRYLTKRETALDSKLGAIHDVVLNTRDNHVTHLGQDVQDNHKEILKEVRDSNAKVIEAVRDSGDKIVNAIMLTQKR